jgi:acetyl esterase/lipase
LCFFAAIQAVVEEMLRWISLGLIACVVLVALLNVVRVPEWAPWRLGVLTGEYGHSLALLPVALVALAWMSRGNAGSALATASTVGGVAAVALLLRPSFTASRIARELPARLERAFGAVTMERPAFSVRRLFVGERPDRVPVETKSFPGELKLDFYRPQKTGGQPVPCVIVVHGGGWDSGDRTQIPQFNHWLAGRGYAVAAISYRLAPAFPWPAQREDLLAAVAWLKAQAAALGVDPTRLVLLGRSAGGQIAQTVGYTANDPAIRGVIGLYAPADLVFGYRNTHENDALKSPALMRQYLGGTPENARANYESASAHYQVRPGVPPTLLVHGFHDTLVWYRHSERLNAKLAEAGVPRAWVSLPWATHAFEFNLNGPGGQVTTFAVEWFLAAVTR